MVVHALDSKPSVILAQPPAKEPVCYPRGYDCIPVIVGDLSSKYCDWSPAHPASCPLQLWSGERAIRGFANWTSLAEYCAYHYSSEMRGHIRVAKTEQLAQGMPAGYRHACCSTCYHKDACMTKGNIDGAAVLKCWWPD